MSLLAVSDVVFRYSSQSEAPLQNVSFEINPRGRIGLIEPNGAGKTTLLRFLGGELEPISGMVAKRNGLRVVYVPQQCRAPREERLQKYVFAADQLFGEIRRKMRTLEADLEHRECATRYAVMVMGDKNLLLGRAAQLGS